MTFPILPSNSQTGYFLQRSLRFRASASAYLSRTPASASNQRTFTWSGWFKNSTTATDNTFIDAYLSASDETPFRTSSNQLVFSDYFGGAYRINCSTAAVFRDPASWYHIVLAVDTTQATNSNGVKIWVNGVQQTLTFSAYTQNIDTRINSATSHKIGRSDISGSSRYTDGYLAEVNFIDGQALTPSSFGSTNSTTGVWQPAKYTGTYGTNGFYLPFTDNSALTTSSNVGLGKDFSGNGNYWTTNNISITAGVTYDSMTDVPTLTSATAANYCVLSPIDNSSNGVQVVLSNANLELSLGSGQGRATFSVSSGKWYWEITSGTTNQGMFGIIKQSVPIASATFSSADGYYYWATNGSKYNNGTGTAYGTGLASGDILGVAFDATAGTLTYYKNNVSLGVAFSGLSGTFSPAFCQGNTTAYATFNFGQRPFAYTPPTGFVALNTYNLPDSTIKKGNKVMDATLYTGNLVGQVITNAASFKPDLVWIKSRSAATDNKLVDSVRGSTLALVSNSTAAETTDLTGVVSLNSNGFTLGTSVTYNNTAATYVGWQWQAGQGSSSSNTSGTITSTVSVNASAGFSVVTYTGTGANATVGHGLGVAPSFQIVKARNNAYGWLIWHSAFTGLQAVQFDTTVPSSSATSWNSLVPTSSVINIGTNLGSNGSGTTYVAYCWSEIAGFSKFGSYVGNGSADGPFVYCGFTPRFILFKNISVASDWIMYDTARDTYNTMQNILYADLSNAESNSSSYALDALSNGFKPRAGYGGTNNSGNTIIYMAWASNPFKNSLAR